MRSVNERPLDFVLTKDTPYLALTGDQWRPIVRILEKIDRVITASHCIQVSAIGELKHGGRGKLPPLSRWHFQMHFLEYEQISIKV